jgi:hypothetical protein
MIIFLFKPNKNRINIFPNFFFLPYFKNIRNQMKFLDSWKNSATKKKNRGEKIEQKKRVPIRFFKTWKNH